MNPFLMKSTLIKFSDSLKEISVQFHSCKVSTTLQEKIYSLKTRFRLYSIIQNSKLLSVSLLTFRRESSRLVSSSPAFSSLVSFVLLLTSLLFFPSNTNAQNQNWQPPKGQFLSDSLKVGLPIKYALSYRHKPTADIFFPDSTYNFAPFELVSREYFPTVTNPKGSLDSAIYTLISFEVLPVQELSLPVFVRDNLDCTRVFAPIDYVRLQGTISANGNIDTMSLKKDTQVIPLSQQPNYPIIFLFIIGLSFLGAITFWFFGTPIKRQIKLFRFKRRYDEYLRLFQRLSKATDDKKKGLENVEKAVILWKKYVERLENKPFTTFTTKEILDNLQDNRLSEALREIDATVYGGIYSRTTASSLNILQELAESLYKKHRQILVQST